MKQQLQHYKKILCIRTDRIGDMMVTTPAFRALRQAFPQAKIDVLGSKSNIQALLHNPDVNAVHALDKKKLSSWLRLLMILPREKYDLALVFHAESSTGRICAKMARAKETYAIAVKKRPYLFTETFAPINELHQIERQLHLLRCLNIPTAETSDRHMHFVVRPEVQERVVAAHPRKLGLKRIGLFIGNIKKIHSRWPETKFAELSKRLLELPTEIYVMAGPGDEPLFQAFESLQNERVLLHSGGSLEESAALFKTCELFVSSSTGPQHIADALDIPSTLILFQGNAKDWGPLNDKMHSRVISTNANDVRDVSVESVYQAVLKTLSGTP